MLPRSKIRGGTPQGGYHAPQSHLSNPISATSAPSATQRPATVPTGVSHLRQGAPRVTYPLGCLLPAFFRRSIAETATLSMLRKRTCSTCCCLMCSSVSCSSSTSRGCYSSGALRSIAASLLYSSILIVSRPALLQRQGVITTSLDLVGPCTLGQVREAREHDRGPSRIVTSGA